MSINAKPSSGGGLSAEQLEQLVSDADLSAADAAVLAQVQSLLSSVASTDQLDSVRQTLLMMMLSYTNSLTGVTTSARDSVLSAISSSRAAVLNELQNLSTASAGSAATSGEIRVFRTVGGVAPAGWTRLSGVVVPQSYLYSTSRSVIGALPSNSASVMYGTNTVHVSTPNGVVFCMGVALNSSYTVGTDSWASNPTNASLYGSNYAGGGIAYIYSTGKVYSLGGGNASNSPQTGVFAYNVSTQQWSSAPSLPEARRLVLAATQSDGTVVIAGGLSASTTNATDYTSTCWIFNPSTGTYAVKSNAPVRMSGGRSVVLSNGWIAFFPNTVSNGTTVTTSNRRVFIYKPASDTWVEADSLPAEIAFSASALIGQLSDGTVLYVPQATPTAGARARRFNPAAAAGSQWTDYAWTSTRDGTGDIWIGSLATQGYVMPDGYLFSYTSAYTSSSSAVYAPTLSYVDTNGIANTELFVAVKN